MPILFEPFKSANPRAGGLGLGLYIAKQLAEAHGASLEAASDADDCTTFTVSLPRRPVPERGLARLTL
jgi:signal transduction histidine kinase